MNARTLILAILNFQEATGYEIRKKCSEGPYSYFVDISYGSIYPTLAKLESEKCVTCRMEQDSGKPERKVYVITDKGRSEFAQSIILPPARDKFKSEFLLVAMNAEIGTKQSVGKAIDERIEHLEIELKMIRENMADCEHAGTRWVGRLGEHVMQSDLDFLRKNRDELMTIAGSASAFKVAAE